MHEQPLALMTARALKAIVVLDRRAPRFAEGRTMKPMQMPANELDHEARERLLVHEWRAEQLRRVGLPRMLADVFADLVDWHALAALVDRGCPPQLALEIVR
jgi:hypothetical protein